MQQEDDFADPNPGEDEPALSRTDNVQRIAQEAAALAEWVCTVAQRMRGVEGLHVVFPGVGWCLPGW